MTKKTALITGVTGQDGAYLADFCSRRATRYMGSSAAPRSLNTGRVDALYVDPHEQERPFFLHYGDMTDATNLIRLVPERSSRTRSITSPPRAMCR